MAEMSGRSPKSDNPSLLLRLTALAAIFSSTSLQAHPRWSSHLLNDAAVSTLPFACRPRKQLSVQRPLNISPHKDLEIWPFLYWAENNSSEVYSQWIDYGRWDMVREEHTAPLLRYRYGHRYLNSLRSIIATNIYLLRTQSSSTGTVSAAEIP